MQRSFDRARPAVGTSACVGPTTIKATAQARSDALGSPVIPRAARTARTTA
jgi:hypothetical protein